MSLQSLQVSKFFLTFMTSPTPPTKNCGFEFKKKTIFADLCICVDDIGIISSGILLKTYTILHKRIVYHKQTKSWCHVFGLRFKVNIMDITLLNEIVYIFTDILKYLSKYTIYIIIFFTIKFE